MIQLKEVKGFTLALDRSYDAERHLWVQEVGEGRVRIGMDPLGVETSGDIVQLALEPPGAVERGGAFGSLEAAKFVGPLEMPISGTVVRTNDDAVRDPGIVQSDPLGAGWLVEAEPTDATQLADLLGGEDAIVPWFEAKVDEYRLKGMIAE